MKDCQTRKNHLLHSLPFGTNSLSSSYFLWTMASYQQNYIPIRFRIYHPPSLSPKETSILYAKVIYSQRKMCYFFISTKGITQMKNKKKSISKCQVSLVAQPLSDKVTRIFQNVINLGFFSHHKTGEVIDSIHRFSLASSITIFTRESQRVKVRGKKCIAILFFFVFVRFSLSFYHCVLISKFGNQNFFLYCRSMQ